MYSDFELQGVIDDKLNCKNYQAVAARMHAEETTCSLLLAQQDTGSAVPFPQITLSHSYRKTTVAIIRGIVLPILYTGSAVPFPPLGYTSTATTLSL